MPIIKQAKKRVDVNETKRLQNDAVRVNYRKAMKKFEHNINSHNLEDAKAEYRNAEQKLEVAVSKGAIHKNKAARHKSQMAKKLNELSA